MTWINRQARPCLPTPSDQGVGTTLQGAPIERKAADVLRSVLAALLGIGIIVGVATLEGAAALSVTACATTDASTIYTPVTGVIVRAEPLVAGYGCGELPGEVYKYAAVAEDSTGHLVAAQIYDCFADGIFVNLNPASGVDATAALDFTVLIYAWDLTAYTATYGPIADAISAINAGGSTEAGSSVNPFDTVPATWKTTCQATQTTNIEELAVCAPLAPAGPTSPGQNDGAARD